MNGTRVSLLFSFGEKYALLVLGIAGSMVVARLLTPAEIGVYSVGAVLLGSLQVLRDFGVGQYLVQENTLDAGRLRAVVATSYLTAWPMAALVLAAAGPVARFYRDPRLEVVLQLLALNFVLIPFTAVTLPLLRRQLRFGAICAINLAHGVANFGVGAGLALAGFGYLSLAIASLAATAAALCASLWFRPSELPWLPARAGIGRVLGFGAYATGGTLIDEAGVAAPDLIVAKAIGMEGAGVFGKAAGVLAVFNQAITSAVSPVVFALFAASARDGHDPNRPYLLAVSYMTALAWPFFAFVGLMALPLVRLLYGDRWDAAAPLIEVMCAAAALYSMFSMARYLFIATGHVKSQARLDALAVAGRVAALLLAAPFGLAAVAWAVLAGALWRCWLTWRCLARCSALRWLALAAAVRKSLLLAGLCTMPPLAVRLGLEPGPVALLLAGTGWLLCWVGGIYLVKHEIVAEFDLLRRKLGGMAVAAATHFK